ncbi:tetraacyldisaccharide 4'-kinase [Oceanibaculum sp.]|uniref:tetraacyldisaccharide 4'-kinase n=1 Tax=Oceanibaculum sp. TaxID=1903597 RepID=UPI00258B815B|nr:tetraacyldisaccharide 4'-kinase [Oceanibaculum sp.]MCH2393441.1 tetraacyldisaccharide 4'-kinase [Oceanibaculum sp.]
MRAPGFWERRGDWRSRLLSPAAFAYGWAARCRARTAQPWTASVPVICIGNLVAGGAGKTPVALAIMALLKDRGVAAHFLSRGHGGSLTGPVRVDPEVHSAADVGDEPLLLAEAAPAWVSGDRVAGAKAAIAAGAQAIVMDDGFQNPSLAKSLSLIVVDGGYGFGNGLLLPAGPLREPVTDGLAHAQAVVLIGEDRTGAAAQIGNALPILPARLTPVAGADLTGRRVLAFAGIGRPEKFFESLSEAGAEIVESAAFPDHYPYSTTEIAALAKRADDAGLLPVTTRKDWVRLPPAYRDGIAVLDVILSWQDAAAPMALLDALFARRTDTGQGNV